VRLDLSLVLEIALVGNNHDGEVVLVLNLDSVSSSKTNGHRANRLDAHWSRRKSELTLRICWWNVETSSNELREVIE
jgi:hypothetical protein